MGKPLRILLVEDNRDDDALIERQLRAGGYDPVLRRVETAEEMRAALHEEGFDAVVADYNLPRFNALEALETLRAAHEDLPFIIVSGGIGEEVAAAAMKAGAHDYVMKDNLKRLVPAIEREIRDAADRLLARQGEEALRESEARYRALVENAPEAIVVLDVDRNAFVDANDNAVKLFKLPLEQLLSVGPEAVCPPFQSDGLPSEGLHRGYVDRALRGGRPVFEWLHRDAEGKEIPCEVRFIRLPSSKQRLIRGQSSPTFPKAQWTSSRRCWPRTLPIVIRTANKPCRRSRPSTCRPSGAAT